MADRKDDAIEQVTRPLEHVEMTERYGIERARVQRHVLIIGGHEGDSTGRRAVARGAIGSTAPGRLGCSKCGTTDLPRVARIRCLA